VSAGLSGASQPERVPISGSGLLFACTAAAAAAVGFPFDPVLAGMVAAGQGIQAICLYLGLTRPALDEHLVRLGLRTPHERPLRKPGPRGWSVLDTIRLIGWRVAGIHPETIGQRLGRSANAVRAKARRLGLPRPDRRSLRRVDPAGLKDPGPSIAFAAPAEEAEAPSQSPSAECGAVAGVVPVRPGQLADGISSSRPEAILPSPVAPSTPGDSANAQGELPLVCVDPAKSPPAKQDMLLVSRPSVLAQLPPRDCEYWREIGEHPEGVGLLLEDLGWIANLRSLRLNGVAVLAMGLRSMGGQHWRSIAADARLTSGCTRTELSRSLLPRDFDRRKFGPSWNAECAFATLEFSGYELAEDEQGRFFWRHRRDRRNVHCSRKQREEIGAEDGCERRESQQITLLTREDLAALPERSVTSFADVCAKMDLVVITGGLRRSRTSVSAAARWAQRGNGGRGRGHKSEAPEVGLARHLFAARPRPPAGLTTGMVAAQAH
jgi:hypothetical protein